MVTACLIGRWCTNRIGLDETGEKNVGEVVISLLNGNEGVEYLDAEDTGVR